MLLYNNAIVAIQVNIQLMDSVKLVPQQVALLVLYQAQVLINNYSVHNAQVIYQQD